MPRNVLRGAPGNGSGNGGAENLGRNGRGRVRRVGRFHLAHHRKDQGRGIADRGVERVARFAGAGPRGASAFHGAGIFCRVAGSPWKTSLHHRSPRVHGTSATADVEPRRCEGRADEAEQEERDERPDVDGGSSLRIVLDCKIRRRFFQPVVSCRNHAHAGTGRGLPRPPAGTDLSGPGGVLYGVAILPLTGTHIGVESRSLLRRLLKRPSRHRSAPGGVRDRVPDKVRCPATRRSGRSAR